VFNLCHVYYITFYITGKVFNGEGWGSTGDLEYTNGTVRVYSWIFMELENDPVLETVLYSGSTNPTLQSMTYNPTNESIIIVVYVRISCWSHELSLFYICMQVSHNILIQVRKSGGIIKYCYYFCLLSYDPAWKQRIKTPYNNLIIMNERTSFHYSIYLESVFTLFSSVPYLVQTTDRSMIIHYLLIYFTTYYPDSTMEPAI
jgi:hypothetical protein